MEISLTMRRFASLSALALGLAWPGSAFALQLPSNWTLGMCAFIPCPPRGAPGAAGFAGYIADKFIPALLVAFVGLLALSLFISAFNMIIYAYDEGQVKEARMNFVYALVASALVGFAGWITIAFDPRNPGVVDLDPIAQAIANIIAMIQLMLLILFIVNLVVQAMRLIGSHGEQEYIDRARKRLINSLIGVGVVLLANSITNAAKPGANSNIVAVEIVGIANFMLALIGMLAVVAIIIAGILLVVSVNESLKDQAKTAVKVAVIALLIVIISYAIVQTAASLT
jgi:hypothetical protein